jgi:hypothetical protein
VPVCFWVSSVGGTESIILSAGGAESMMLLAWAESMDTLSAGADSIILSALPTESMILLALFGHVITLTAAATKKTTVGGATKKTTIGDTDDCQFTTIANSTSKAAPIGLPPRMAKFCHFLNILLVGYQCRRALLRLYFNSSAVGQSLVLGPL